MSTRRGGLDRIGSAVIGPAVFGSPAAAALAAGVQSQGRSGSGVFPYSAPVFFPKPRWMDAPGAGPAGARGLDRVERKAPEKRKPVIAMLGVANSVVPAWIGIPFVTVFVLACLTLR